VIFLVFLTGVSRIPHIIKISTFKKHLRTPVTTFKEDKVNCYQLNFFYYNIFTSKDMHVDASRSLRTFQFTDFSFFVNAHNVSDSSEKNSNLRVLDQKNRFCNRPNLAERVFISKI
jgi:hypothetical protein